MNSEFIENKYRQIMSDMNSKKFEDVEELTLQRQLSVLECKKYCTLLKQCGGEYVVVRNSENYAIIMFMFRDSYYYITIDNSDCEYFPQPVYIH